MQSAQQPKWHLIYLCNAAAHLACSNHPNDLRKMPIKHACHNPRFHKSSCLIQSYAQSVEEVSKPHSFS